MIWGNMIGNPVPRADWAQDDEKKADFIRNKPEGLATEAYVDGKHLSGTLVLTAAGWAGTGPYVQTVDVDGITAADCPHYGLVRSGTAEEKAAQKEAFSLIDELETAAGTMTFTCDEEAPGVDLTVMWEVNR